MHSKGTPTTAAAAVRAAVEVLISQLRPQYEKQVGHSSHGASRVVPMDEYVYVRTGSSLVVCNIVQVTAVPNRPRVKFNDFRTATLTVLTRHLTTSPAGMQKPHRDVRAAKALPLKCGGGNSVERRRRCTRKQCKSDDDDALSE